ncbi:MAG: type VI secretion system baseplate subunit TssF [Polyangiaceae bacterium]|nr:type VI secretion system baseplate subunit TssF [Polyangiaceae bacterium]
MFRDHFERELNGLWTRVGRLTQRYPHLQHLFTRDADRRVGRLVQTAAFAFASAQSRVADDGQMLARSLVAAALPECLRPRPASTIVQSQGVRTMLVEKEGKRLTANVEGAEVTFEVMWPVSIAPFELAEARVDRLDAQTQILRFTLLGSGGVALGSALPETVRIFVHLDSVRVALDLIHALRIAKEPIRAVVVDPRGNRSAETELPARSLSWVRVDTEEPPLVSAPRDRFSSSPLLRDLFAFPESFCFFDLHLGAFCSPNTGQLELTLPLGRVTEGISKLDSENLLLFCAPATNQYVRAIEPLYGAGGPRWKVCAAERPRAEILHVQSLYSESTEDASVRVPIHSWEAPEVPHTLDPEDVYYLLEQSISPSKPRTELQVSFATLEGFNALSAHSVIKGEVLVSDGDIADSLGFGDVGAAERMPNVTRVAQSSRAILDEHYPWRMSAYARMPATRLAACAALAEFVRLHESKKAQDNSTWVRSPRFVQSEHCREHMLQGGVFRWGDEFTIDVERDFSSHAETWLIGLFLSRALAERSERLRFVKLTLRETGDVVAEYDARDGERLPFPFG